MARNPKSRDSSITQWRDSRKAVVVGILVLTFSAGHIAFGQTAAGDGRSLDANLSRWYGRYNTPRPRFQLNELNNAIVTGNVGGGKQFRGDVGYRAPFDFRGSTGSDDLYTFTSETFLPSLSSQRSSFLQVPSFRTTGNIRYQSTLQPSFILRRPGSGFSTSVADLSRRQRSITEPIDPSGSLNVLRRPGLSSIDLRDLTLEERLQLAGPRLQVRLERTDTPLYELDMLGRRTTELDAKAMSPTARLRTELNRRLMPTYDDLFGFGAAREETAGSSMERGLPRRDMRRGTPAEQREKSRLEAESTGPRASAQIVPGVDPYADMLARMIADANGITWTPGEEPYSERMIEAIERFNERYREDAAGSARFGVQSETQDEDRLRIPELDELPHTELPEIRRLTGDTSDEFTKLMQDAETALRERRFFEAERAFSEAIEFAPDYPLAQAGKAHAQLGAGLYRSASRSLRRLIANHPELLYFTYNETVTPGADRLEEIIRNIRRLDELGSLPESGLLLAYAGRLAGDMSAIRDGVEIMERDRPDDPLIARFRSAWLDEIRTSEDEGETDAPSTNDSSGG